jgi:hypothetical protein
MGRIAANLPYAISIIEEYLILPHPHCLTVGDLGIEVIVSIISKPDSFNSIIEEYLSTSKYNTLFHIHTPRVRIIAAYTKKGWTGTFTGLIIATLARTGTTVGGTVTC